MSFARVQSENREFNQLQSNLATRLQQYFNNPLLNGTFVNDVVLAIGTNTINHPLNGPVTGWFVTMIDGAAQIYDLQTSNTSPNTTLLLVSDAAVTVNLYIF